MVWLVTTRKSYYTAVGVACDVEVTDHCCCWMTVKESCVSVCWQRGWQSRVTARLGLTGGNGGSGVSAAFAVFTGEAGAPGVSARMIRGARILCLTVVTSGFVP